MNPSVLQLKECVSNANSFLRVAESIEKDGLSALVMGGLNPLVVNVAFSIELYLKSIKAHESATCEYPTGHKLDELFKILKPSTQQQIKTSFAQRSEVSLDDLLSEASNSFVEWRYSHEKSVDAHPFELIKFAQILRDYTEKL